MTALESFNAALAADPTLREKAQAIWTEVNRQYADRLASLAAELGIPLTAQEIIQASSTDELAPSDLENISGGLYIPPREYPPGPMKIF